MNIRFFFSAVLVIITFNLSAQTPTFQQFLAQFPATSLPFAMEARSLRLEAKKQIKSNCLDWKYYEFLPELELIAASTQKPVHVEVLGKFGNKNYYAVVYKLNCGFSAGTTTYYVSLFNKKGVHVATHLVAQAKQNQALAVYIDNKMQATLTYYQYTPTGQLIESLTSSSDVDLFKSNVERIGWTGVK